MATDSRLTGFGTWDCGPKLLALPRGDAALCFAGHTLYAYPIMIQAVAAINQHARLLSRAMDLHDLKGHLLRVLNSMIELMREIPDGQETPDVLFLLAGWSWRKSKFVSWTLHYDSNIGRFTFRPGRRWAGAENDKYLTFIGDYYEPFKERLVELLRSKKKLARGGFDMEPFEVLRDMIRSNDFSSIGGAPQIMKVYKHMNCVPYALFWPSGEAQKVSLLGRPLLDYEKSQYLVLDPDSLKTIKHVELA